MLSSSGRTLMLAFVAALLLALALLTLAPMWLRSGTPPIP